jgi:deoxyribonuclease-4
MNEKYIGAHVSTSGGVENAVKQASLIGAGGFAIFTRNQRRWNSPSLSDESVSRFREGMEKYGYTAEMVLPHNSYLINLANPDPEKRDKSFGVFIDELQRVRRLGLKYLNFHPGSTLGQITKETGIEYITGSINRALDIVKDVVMVLETTSGQSNKIGGRFEELGKSRIAVCIDTCHIFAAGYGISTAAGWEATIGEFDRIIGLKYLTGIHLNDSRRGLGEHIDRHENIGKGQIGMEGFKALIRDPRLERIPMILETPNPAGWKEEIKMLKSFLE